MRQREARRILEAIRRAVHDLGHHGERLHRAGADAWGQQQLGKVDGSALGGGGERAVQSPREHVGRAYVVVGRHDEMRQLRLRRRLLG